MKGKIVSIFLVLFMGVLLTAFVASDSSAIGRKGCDYDKTCPLESGQGYGMGMMDRHGMGGMGPGMHRMMATSVDVDVKETKEGVTITLTTKDEKARKQLQLWAEMMKLMHEMMKLQMEGMEGMEGMQDMMK